MNYFFTDGSKMRRRINAVTTAAAATRNATKASTIILHPVYFRSKGNKSNRF
jgi:hypothetical protein